MSWEAVTWANRQQLKKSFEQVTLLVIANAADPNGEAFVKWPGRDHWWHYLSKKTRLPKSSLFRQINTLVALGLCERTMQVLADGSKRPTITLVMSASFDIETEEDAERYARIIERKGETQSPVGTGDDDDFEGAENGNDISGSQVAEMEPAPQSRIETGQSPVETGAAKSIPSTGTEPFPVLGMHKDSLLVSKDSPQPPSGGTRAVDELWEEFVRSWGEPIPKMAVARSAWDHVESTKRTKIVAAARGYWGWLKVHPKPPSPQSAQSFIRDQAGWEQWLRYVPDAGGIVPSITATYPLGGAQAKALVVLYEVAGKADFLRQFMQRSGAINYQRPMTQQIAALANAGPRDTWPALSRQQAGAWEAFLKETVTVQVRNRRKEGDRAPWPWPPRPDGSLYAATTDPPGSLMSEDDFENFK